MPKTRQPAVPRRIDDGGFATRPRKQVPFEFVLEALEGVATHTRPMFGCLAIYAGEKIVLILRDKAGATEDNGVWLATTPEHHQSLQGEFPNMRTIRIFGAKVSGWQVLPSDSPDFEEAALHACELVAAGDRRIGKVPGTRKRAGAGKKAARPRKSHG